MPPPNTLSRTCIAETFLWCYEPENGHDKGYVSRVYEREDGKFVHRYEWGRRFATYQPKEEVHPSRAAAMQKHEEKVNSKRFGRSRYRDCRPSELGFQSEMVLVVPQTPPTPFPGTQPPITSHPAAQTTPTPRGRRVGPQQARVSGQLGWDPAGPRPAPPDEPPRTLGPEPELAPGGNRVYDWD